MSFQFWGPTILFLALTAPLVASGPPVVPGQKGDEEARDFYRKWISEDVFYIVTEEEREVFSKLETDEEKERFIEDFWRRRDPDPKTAANEFREEHYRRLAYANERFKVGRSGWRTDRGRAYILYGPPDNIRSRPAGSLYNRPLSEGGGQTKTFPFEVWSYRSIPGLGSDIELEFVDSELSGDYHLALGPDEKDALLYVPGAGSTYLEQMGAQTRSDRIHELGLLRPLDSSQAGFKRERSFDRLKRFFDLRNGVASNAVRFREEVDTSIRYDELPFDLRTDWFWAFDKSFLVPLTLEVSNRELDFTPMAGAADQTQQTKVNIYGSVEDLSGRQIHEFERDLQVTATPLERSQGKSIFQEILPLESGRYKLTLVVRDQDSGKLGSSDRLLLVPPTPEGLFASPLILAREILPGGSGAELGEPFVTASGLKIYPTPSERVLSRKVGLYVEFYGFAVDGASGLPELEVEADIRDSEDRALFSQSLSDAGAVRVSPERAAVSKYLYLEELPPGRMTLRVTCRDLISKSETVASTPLVLPPAVVQP